MGVLGGTENSLREAAQRMMTPSEEQVDNAVPEEEVVEEETLDADDTNPEEASEVEDEEGEETSEQEVGDSDVEEEAPEEKDEEPDEEFFTVKVDGEEYEVNLEELKKGYQLEKNYTKKAQALAEERKAFEADAQALEAERQKYIQINQAIMQEHFGDLERAKGELAKLDRTEDPAAYFQKELEVRQIGERLQSRVQGIQHAQTEMQKAQQEKLKSYLVEQDALLKSQLDGWSDPVKGPELKSAIAQYAMSSGYSEKEVGSIASARDLLVINKARLYDEMMSKKAKIRDKKVPEKTRPVVKPSTTKPATVKKAESLSKAKQKARHSGDKKDAVAALKELFKS